MSSRSHGVDILPVTCPWCFESVDIFLESDSEAGEWVEDCPVCCHPMTLLAVDNDQEGVRLVADRSH